MPDTATDGFAGLAPDETDALLERAGSLIASGARLPAAALEPLHQGIERSRDNRVRAALAQSAVVLARAEDLRAEAHGLLHHDRSEVREAAYDGLVERSLEALPALEELAGDDDRNARWFV